MMIRIKLIGTLAGAALFFASPAYAEDPTPVPTPVATATPVATVTPVPTATPLPIFPPRVILFQDFTACGIHQVRASYEGTIIPFRVILTRNGYVMPLTQVDFFGSVNGILLSVPTLPGDVFMAYAFPQNTAPAPLPGTLFQSHGNLVGQVIVNQVPPCAVATAVATPNIQAQVEAAVRAAMPTVVPPVATQLPVIRPPATGDAGLAQ